MRLAAGLLAASDPVDLGAWERLLAEDVHVRVANRRPAVGRPRCLGELARLFRRVEAFGRGFRELWPSADGEMVLMELDLWPAVPGPALPVAVVARLIAPVVLARDVRFYLDPAPLGLAGADGSGPRGDGAGRSGRFIACRNVSGRD